MNWNPTQPPKSDIAPRFARTSDEERKIPSLTSGDAAVRSRAMNAASTATSETAYCLLKAALSPADLGGVPRIGVSKTGSTGFSTPSCGVPGLLRVFG